MTAFGLIGAKALYLLFRGCCPRRCGSWLSDRKGYGERVGLTFGLLLSAIGLVIVLLLPGRPGSRWKVEGPLPHARPAARQLSRLPRCPPGGPAGQGRRQDPELLRRPEPHLGARPRGWQSTEAITPEALDLAKAGSVERGQERSPA